MTDKVTQIPISKLHVFEGHPYKVLDNEEMDELTESVRSQGILSPLIVRPLENRTDEYEVVSGHRRLHAAQRAGLETVPAFIYALDRDAAVIALVDSNLHREHILPSEKAFAYKMKMDALNHQGIACGQVGHKSRDDVSETESGRTVQRYIRLTHLVPELLDMMDEGRIAFSVGVELSYLDETEQYDVLEICEMNDCTPSYSQSWHLHREFNNGTLDKERIFELLSEDKPNQRDVIRVPREKLKGKVPDGLTEQQKEDFILKACEHYSRFLQKQRKQAR